MTNKPKGECKVCRNKVAVRRDGTLQLHGGTRSDPFNPGSYCEGSCKRGWALDADGNKIPKEKV